MFPPPVPEPPPELTARDVEPTHFIPVAPLPDAPPLEPAEQAREHHGGELIAACEAELAKKPEPARAARLHYEMARTYEVALDDLDKACAHYLAARNGLPDHLPTLRGGRRVLVALGRHQEALPFFDAEMRLLADAHGKAMVLYEKGVLLEDRLSDRKEARRAYAAALELDESNPTILKAAARASLLASEWDDLDRTYEREANAVSSDPRHRAAIVSERARLAEAKKGAHDRSIELYQTALEIDPAAPGALSALKNLLYVHERFRDLIAVLEEEARVATDPETRALAKYRVGRIAAGRLGSLDEAITALEGAALDAPSDIMVLEELARLYELGKRWPKLASVLETMAGVTPSADERVALMHRIGQISEERLADPERATDWYRRALDNDPSCVPVLQALAKLYAQRQNWTALIAMHLGESSTAHDVTRRASAHARVAEIYERNLDNPEQAIEHHSRALGLVPGYQASFKALSRLYSQGERFRELVELYQRAVDHAKDVDTKITYLFKIGRIHEDALGVPLSAAEAYEKILALDGSHMGALHALERATERGEAWDRHVAALDREADLTRDAGERAQLIHRAAEVAEDRLTDVEGAVTRYRKVLALDEKYAPALASLGRLYYRAGRWEDLLSTYQLELSVTAPGGSTAALLCKMGELAEERVGKDEDAVRYYRSAVEASPKHMSALRALVRLESGSGRFREVVRLLEIELRGTEDKAARARTAFRIADVYENRLDDRTRALEAYGRALADAPDFRPALDGRARLLERAKDYAGLVETLERDAANARDPRLAILARQRAGEVYRDHLGQTEKAIEAFEVVLAQDPNHLGALLALESLYVQLGATDRLEQCLMGQARIFENGFARVAVLRELARLEENRVAPAPGEIAERYLTIVRLSPTDAAALGALERTAIASKSFPLLAQVDTKLGAIESDPALAAAHQTRLGEALELTGNPSALDTYRAALARDPDNISAARGLSRLAERAGDPTLLEECAVHVGRVLRDPDRAASLLLLSARIRHERRRDPAGAATDLEKALEICPDHTESAVRLYDILLGSDVGRLADILSHAAGRALDPERRAAIWVTVASLHADRRSDIGAGLSALARARKDRPAYVPALMKEAELYVRDGRAPEAVKCLEDAVKATSDAQVLLPAHIEMASLLAAEHPDRAMKSLHAALGFEPNHRRALGMLLELETAGGSHAAASETAGKLVAASPPGPERADALTRLARLERARSKVPEAIEAYRQAVAVVGVDGPALEEMRGLLSEMKKKGEPVRWEAYADGLSQYLDKSRPDDARLGPVYLELSRVHGTELRQPDKAVQTLRVAVARFPRDAKLRAELAGRLRGGGRIADAAEELRKLVELDPLRKDVWHDLADSFTTLGKADLARYSTEICVALGGGTDLERMNAEARVARPATLAAGSFDPETLRLLDAGVAEDLATTRLFAAVAPGLERAHPPDLEAFGVTRSERLTSRSGHPLRLLADRIARAFGDFEFDLYVHQAHAGAIEVEFSDPASVLVPVHVTTMPEAHQAFLLARVFADMSRGLHAVHKLAPSSVGELLGAGMRIVDPSYGSGTAQAEYLESLSKNLYKGLPRRARRPLEEAAGQYGPSPKPRLEDWLLRVRKTSTRAALLVSDDPAGALGLLRRTEGDQAGLEGATLERGMAVVADMVAFVVSDAAHSVRRRLGVGG